MCTTPKIDKPKPVQPPPTKSDVDVSDQKRRVADAQGVFSNITSPLGDTTYGTNARKPKLATLGATA